MWRSDCYIQRVTILDNAQLAPANVKCRWLLMIRRAWCWLTFRCGREREGQIIAVAERVWLDVEEVACMDNRVDCQGDVVVASVANGLV